MGLNQFYSCETSHLILIRLQITNMLGPKGSSTTSAKRHRETNRTTSTVMYQSKGLNSDQKTVYTKTKQLCYRMGLCDYVTANGSHSRWQHLVTGWGRGLLEPRWRYYYSSSEPMHLYKRNSFVRLILLPVFTHENYNFRIYYYQLFNIH